MSAPYAPPPLPFGWTEHLSKWFLVRLYSVFNSTGPTGQPYYFNVNTKESTYVRPILPPMAQPLAKKKKEKPLVKTPIPGTDWLRVKTTEGNIFYSHKIKKESIWHVPDEIKAEVEALEKQEREAAVSSDVSREIDRVKSEVADAVKRKAEEPIPVDEVVVTKKAKTNNAEDESDESEEEEEEWEQEAAAQLAAEAEEEKQRVEEETKRLKDEEEAENQRLLAAQLTMPKRVDLSVEEAKALFKASIRYLNCSSIFHIALDTTQGEGYKSATSLGRRSTKIRVRSSVCSASIGFRSSRGIR